MIRRISLEEDLALKRLVTLPREQKPDFAWRDALGDSSATNALPQITITRGGQDQEFPYLGHSFLQIARTLSLNSISSGFTNAY